jgi:hypothetical protein
MATKRKLEAVPAMGETLSPLASAPVLADLPLADMIELRDRLTAMIDERLADERNGALQWIRERMLHFGITVKDIHEATKKRRKRRGMQ